MVPPPTSAPEVHSLTARTVNIYFAEAVTHPDFPLEAYMQSLHPDAVQLKGMVLEAQTERSKKAMKKHMAKVTPRRIQISVSGKGSALLPGRRANRRQRNW